MGRGLDKPTAARAREIFAEWLERTGDHRLAAERAGVSERTGRRWRGRHEPSVGAASPASSAPRTNIRAEATRYVGGGRPIAEVRALFQNGARLVTLTGPGGIGKTRLALRYADVHALDYGGGGTWFVDLGDARGADDVWAAVASALSIALPAGDSARAQLGHALAARGRVLLICDNFEQIAGVAVETVGWLAGIAPRAHFLVTSRAALRLPGESVLDLDALGLPAADERDPARVAASEAVELFVDRARLARPGWTLAPDDALDVRDLVRSLDGMPLAIELCAARMAVLPPRELLSRMTKRFELLVGRTRGMTRRQASMRATIDASWDLLDPVEQDALAQCAVFRAGFDIAAAESVVRVDRPVLDVIQSLVEKSLVYARDDDSGARRLGMYESVREYAAAVLLERDPSETTASRHTHYYATLGARLARQHGDDRARQTLATETENIAAAHECAKKSSVHADLSLSAALALSASLHPRGLLARELQALDVALSRADGSPALRVEVLAARVVARRVLGDIAGALADAAAAHAALEAAGDAPALHALVQSATASVHYASGDTDKAAVAYRAAIESGARAGDGPVEARAHLGLALVFRLRRQFAVALPHAERALELRLAAKNTRQEAETRAIIANLHQSEQRFDDARAAYEAALALLDDGRDPGIAASIRGNLSTLEHELGRLDVARRLAERALHVFRELGLRRLEGCAEGNLAAVHAEAGRLVDARAGLERAVAVLRAANDRVHEGLFLAQLGGVLAEEDDIAGAERSLDAAQAVLAADEGDPLFASLDAQRGFLVLARARAAAREGSADRASELIEAVARIVERLDAPNTTRADDVRVAVRRLRRALTDGLTARPVKAGAALVIGDEGRDVRAPSGARVALSQRRAPRLLFMRLLEERDRSPGAPLGVDELLAAGWPGERVLADAGASRVYVALGTLRKLGLRSVILSRDGGYLLDPHVPVVRVQPPES